MQPLDAPFAVQYVAVPKSESGAIAELYLDGHYFGVVYQSLSVRFPNGIFQFHDELHVVVNYDGPQLSVMVSPDKLAEQVDLMGRLTLAPF